MPKKIDKKLNTNPNRERFSSFVVDLRQKETVLKREVATEGRKVSRAVKRGFLKVRAGLQPNLLSRAASMRPSKGKSLLTRLKARWSDSHLNLRSLFSVRQSPWQKFSSQREREFQTAVQYTAQRVRRFKIFKKGIFSPKIRPLAEARWYRPLISFVIVLGLIIAPFKLMAYFQVWDFAAWEAGIKEKSEQAVGNLMAAADAVGRQDFQEADMNFQAASVDFLAAQSELGRLNDGILLLAGFSSDPKVRVAAEGKKFLAAGAAASSLGRNLVLATDNLFNKQEENFSRRLDEFLQYGAAAVADARVLEKIVSGIDANNLPDGYREQFLAISAQAGNLADNLSEFVAVAGKLKNILGLTGDKRYLVVFQNNAELRASGGFLGSYALVDIRDGQIRNLEVPAGGSYDTEAGRRVLVAAPEPLWLVDPLWHFWDANWWPDWPTTARNLMWFYEKSDGPSVDGVIGVTPTVVESLLDITGPIDMTADYGIVIDAQNFWEAVETVVERDNLAFTHPEAVAAVPVGEANKPKKIIGDLLVKIMEVLPQKLDRENMLKIISVFEENMAAKQILVYLTDSSLQAEISARNWGGEIRETDGDYLMVVNTNIAGQKTDRLMEETINHESRVDAGGAIINTVTITRTHTGLKDAPLTGVRNVDWMRIYVPAGSRLISAQGFLRPDEEYLRDRPDPSWESLPELDPEKSAAIDPLSGTKIYEENGKTVFAHWLMVDPGETGVVTLEYQLPQNFYDPLAENGWREKLNSWLNPAERELIPYSLLVQKQPGAAPSAFSSSLVLPEGWKTFWRHPEELSGSAGWDLSASVSSDQIWSILVKKNNQ